MRRALQRRRGGGAWVLFPGRPPPPEPDAVRERGMTAAALTAADGGRGAGPAVDAEVVAAAAAP